MGSSQRGPVTAERRVILAFILSALVGIVLVGVALWSSLQRTVLAQCRTNMESLAGILAAQCDSEISQARRDLEFLAKLPAFQQLPYADKIDPRINGVPEDVDVEKRQVLAQFMNKAKHFNVLYVLAPNADIYILEPFRVQAKIRKGNLADRPYFQEAARNKDTAMSDSFVGAEGIPVVVIFVPVLTGTGKITGYVGGVLYLSGLSEMVSKERIKPFDAGFIVDRNGVLIAHTDTELLKEGVRERFTESHPLLSRFIASMESGRVSRNKPDHKQVFFDECAERADARRHMTALVPLNSGWSFGLMRNRAAVLAEARPVIWGVTALAGLLLVISSGIGVAFAHRVGRRWKTTERALRDSEESFRATFNQAAVGIAQVAPGGHWLQVNQRLCDIVGYPQEELLGLTFQDITHPDDLESDLEYVQQVLSGEIDHYSMEKRYICKDRSIVWINLTVGMVRTPAGEPAYFISVVEDITKRKMAEDALRQHKEHLEELVEERTKELNVANEHLKIEALIKAGIVKFRDALSGDLDIETLASRAISEMAQYVGAKVGAIYAPRSHTDTALSLVGSYAWTKREGIPTAFEPGEGLVGQAAMEKKQILIKDVPKDYLKVTSGLGNLTPRQICVTPFLLEDRVKGVVELGTLDEVTDLHRSYLITATAALAVAIESAQARDDQVRLLEKSQRLTEDLQAQQEELRAANEELEEQTQLLKESEEKLKAQQEELQVTNEELEEKNDLLERQKKEVEEARSEIAEKAEELALASKYKSEFLANMSHELRSPLNSLLLLAQGLAQNKEGNLTGEQVESARIIHGGGSDLLNLINEILDLSKIEAGRMDLRISKVRVSDLAKSTRASFSHLAEEKGLDLKIIVNKEAPFEITSDQKRVEQVIRNLMSNAIKFTEKGSVTLTFDRPSPGVDLSKSGLAPDQCLTVAVNDTGIGIAPEYQKIVFEAFLQVDGGTTRKYGGTGLGLSISREITHLLGGEIHLESEPGKGSTFTLYLPVELTKGQKIHSGHADEVAKGDDRDDFRQRISPAQIEDDREKLEKGDQVILVIEDDLEFARILYKKCHEKGLKCLVAPTGEAGLELAGKHLPGAVILDIRLPGIDGWAVLSALKENTRTRHIPVHVASVEADPVTSFSKGALGHVTKPLSQEDIDKIFQRLEVVSAGRTWRLLVVEDNPEIRRSIVELIGNGDVFTDEAGTGEQALEALRSSRYNCLVLDLGLPDMSGSELLARAEREGIELPPVVVHTARDLTREEETELREHAESIVIKDVRSQERLLDEVSLFLHRVVSQMPEKKQKIIRDLHDTDAFLMGKKVLIVDDDMRTTFALSKRLSERGMNALKAENGERALLLLDQEPDVDMVLMDIMMPVMDGYEAIRKIRGQERFRKLPILALTAKAMPEDREKCLEAGASDYLTKPVDEGRLISMMRVWLYR